MRKIYFIILFFLPLLTACMSSSEYEDYVFYLDDDYKVYIINDFEEETQVVEPLQYLEANEQLTHLEQGGLRATTNAFNKLDELTRLYKNNENQLMTSSNGKVVFSITDKLTNTITGVLICDLIREQTCERQSFTDSIDQLNKFYKTLNQERFFFSVVEDGTESIYLIDEELNMSRIYNASSQANLDVIDYDLQNAHYILLGIRNDQDLSYTGFVLLNLRDYSYNTKEFGIRSTNISSSDFNIDDDERLSIKGLPFNDERMLACNQNLKTKINSCFLINEEREKLESYINGFDVIGFLNQQHVVISETNNLYVYNYSKKTINKINDHELVRLNSNVDYFSDEDTYANYDLRGKKIGNNVFISIENVNTSTVENLYKTYVIDESKREITTEYNKIISNNENYHTNKMVILRSLESQDSKRNLIMYHRIFGEFTLEDKGQRLDVFDDGIYYIENGKLQFFDVRYGKKFSLLDEPEIKNFDVVKVAKNHYLLTAKSKNHTYFLRYKNNEVYQLDYLDQAELGNGE